jgi:hypothetical protein
LGNTGSVSSIAIPNSDTDLLADAAQANDLFSLFLYLHLTGTYWFSSQALLSR